MRLPLLYILAGAVAIPLLAPASPVGPSEAVAQQMGRQPFNFRIRNNPAAANKAIAMEQLDRQRSNGNTAVGPGGSIITQYSSTSVGNLSEITTILDNGAQGYVGLNTDQQGANSSQSAAAEGTQLLGGTNALGDGNASTTNNVEGNSNTIEGNAQKK